MPDPIEPSVLDKLRSVVGSDWVLTDPDRLLVYEADALTSRPFPPQAVVLPTSTDEVAQVMGILHGSRIPVVPRGAGTGLSG